MAFDKYQLDELNEKLLKSSELEKEAANDLLGIQISNAEKLLAYKKQLLNKEKSERLAMENEVDEYMLKRGYDTSLIVNKMALADRLKAIDDEEKQALKGHRGKVRAKIKAEFEEKRKQAEKYDKERAEKEEKEAKKTAKKLGKELSSAVTSAWSDAGLTGIGGALFGGKAAKEAIRESHPEWSDKEVDKASKNLRTYAVEQALANFAKQLESTVNNIAESQTKIDTRLQGSKNSTLLGSYWRRMSTNIVENVGMNPFIKQSAVTENLKTLVAKGISFDVEQRAFLMTVKEGIADTFDAADGTLLKLVRIQQADTTAARLGMESALTSFLNNMYETTEYMTDAAREVRTSLAEAEALMGAKSATAFEYQVQKWMGSLYSVGFGSTTNLSSAFGKLAAGDISGITGDGTGNLLVMAANKAGLSIADILSKGLDDSDTNRLMTAMVQYLSGIYNETHGSNILAQQYAGVFGLTASDLKAAANLSKSISNISSNSLDYNGQIRQLQNMYGSMALRYSTGGMLTNLFDNLKYATAETMANSPTLYTIYTLAGMLDDTVGGIAIPSITTMFGGIDLETTVANLMRVGAMSGGILGGIGKMIAGLAKGGGTALSRFGIGTDLNTVTRGTGTGLLVTKGSSVSDSGYVGSDGSNVQDKTITDAEDSANQKLEAKQEESEEKTLTDVNESVLLIYTLLEEATNGTRKIHVDIDSDAAWTTDGTTSKLSFY